MQPPNASAIPPIVQVDQLIKRYAHGKAVDGISFSVNRGECFGILGPNGAGKSTTLRMLIGLTPIDGGTLKLFDLPMTPDRSDIPRRIGVVSQEDNLDIDLTVSENLLVYGRYFGLSDSIVSERLPRLLTFAQLEDRAHASVRELSGGMKRRLVIARALVAEPELVVLDEPTTGLDPQARHLIWQRLRNLKDQGVTLLLTTHYMDEAAQLCDRLMILNRGKILDMDSPRQLIKSHVEPEVVEIRGVEEMPDIEAFRHFPGRLEKIGDTICCYTAYDDEIIAELQKNSAINYHHRPANLEDVFLKLTGRELRE